MKVLKGIPVGGRRRLNPCYMIALQKLTPTSTPIGYAEAIQMLKDNPILSGLQIRYGWVELEAGLGDYIDASLSSWAEIQSHLDDLNLPAHQGGPRKLSIIFDVKRFDQNYDLVPSYMRDGVNGTYEDGQFDYPSSGGFAAGRNLKFQNANVRARLNSLLAEFGRRFAKEPRIELIGFPEATPGSAPTVYTAYNEAAHLAGVLECLVALKNAMPYTIVRQICNYSRPGMNTFVPNLVNAGIPAYGNPDAVMDEIGLGINTPYNGIYQWHQTYGPKGSNSVCIIGEVQAANYAYTSLTRILQPASAWGTLTLADNAGALQLQGSGGHGVAVGNVVDTINAGAAIWVQTAAGGFPAGAYLDILSIDSANNISVTNRAPWTSPAISARGLNYATATSAGLTSPAAGVRMTSTGYPLGSGFTYQPRATSYTGFVPSIEEIVGFLQADIKPTHLIFTYSTTVNSRTGIRNIDAAINYLNSFNGRHSIHGDLWTTRSANML